MDDCVFLRPSQPMYQDTSKERLYAAAKTQMGANVKRLRKVHGLSQEELGLRIEADQAYISRIESGHLNLTVESIAELAAALETQISKLFE